MTDDNNYADYLRRSLEYTEAEFIDRILMRCLPEEVERLTAILRRGEEAIAENGRLRMALRGVIRVADRETAEFIEARAALEGK